MRISRGGPVPDPSGQAFHPPDIPMLSFPGLFYSFVHGLHEFFPGKAGIPCSRNQITRQLFAFAARMETVLNPAAAGHLIPARHIKDLLLFFPAQAAKHNFIGFIQQVPEDVIRNRSICFY